MDPNILQSFLIMGIRYPLFSETPHIWVLELLKEQQINHKKLSSPEFQDFKLDERLATLQGANRDPSPYSPPLSK